MAESNLLIDIRIRYDQLTKLEKRVADFVLQHPQDAMNMTLSELASHCQVGDTTVFRFCRSMKLAGYQDFKIRLALSAHANEILDTRKDMQLASSRNLAELAEHLHYLFQDTVSEAYSLVDYDAVSRTVDAMLRSESIHLYGFGSSGIAAQLLQNRISRVLSNVFFSPDAHMQLNSAALLKKNSLAIVFCNSGITIDTLKIVEMAHNNGATTVYITRFLQTPAAQWTDILLPCGAAEGPIQGGSLSVIISQIYMIGLLYSDLIRRLDGQATENKIKTSQSIAHRRL